LRVLIKTVQVTSQSQHLNGALRVNVQVSSKLIVHTLREQIGLGCADEVSQHVSRDIVLNRVKGSADGVGRTLMATPLS
jgi:hypothetical protein